MTQDEMSSDKIRLAEAVRRRLLLARLPKVGVTVGPYPGDGYDVMVTIAPPDAELASRVVELCPDIRVKVRQGLWSRT